MQLGGTGQDHRHGNHQHRGQWPRLRLAGAAAAPGWAWCPGSTARAGKQRSVTVTKAGDAYLRSLLVMGARAVLAAAMNTRTP